MKIFWTKKRGWELDVTIAGKRVREHGFDRKSDAETFVAELKVQARRRRFGLERDRVRVTVSALAEKRIEDLDLKQKTDRQRKAVITQFVATLPAGMFLDELCASDFRDYVKQCRSRRNVSETINGKLKFISGMLRVAPQIFPELEEAGWRPPRVPWEKVSKRGKERVITSEEASQLLEALRFLSLGKEGRRLSSQSIAARRDVADVLEIALNTGMRSGEVQTLTWSAVDFEARELHLPKTKTGEPRDIPANARTLEILRRRRKQFGGRWVFSNAAANGPRKDSTDLIRKVARELGLRYGRDVPDGFTLHTSRHTATTAMLRNGHDMKTIQDVLGHSSSTMTLRYSHSTRESRRRAVESLVGLSGPRQKVDNERE